MGPSPIGFADNESKSLYSRTNQSGVKVDDLSVTLSVAVKIPSTLRVLVLFANFFSIFLDLFSGFLSF